jgi:hypothetical protein
VCGWDSRLLGEELVRANVGTVGVTRAKPGWMNDMKKYLVILNACVLISFGSPLLAEEKVPAKEDKKTQEALAVRYRQDLDYAKGARLAANNNLNTWIGAKLSDLIAQWGAPSRMVSDGSDGQVVVYENTVAGTSRGYTPAYIAWNGFGEITNYRPASDTRYNYNYVDYYNFFVDKNKIITRIKSGRK